MADKHTDGAERQALGAWLKALRARHGLSLEAFADSIGYDKSYVSRLEAGISENPSTNFIRAVCRVYQLRPWWFENPGGTTTDEQTRPGVFLKEATIEAPFRREAVIEVLACIAARTLPAMQEEIIERVSALKTLTGVEKMRWLSLLSQAFLHATNESLPEYLGDDALAKECKPSLDTHDQSADKPSVTLEEIIGTLRLKTSRGSQAAIARRLGVTRQAVSQWLSGASRPSAEMALRLLDLLEGVQRNSPSSATNTAGAKPGKVTHEETKPPKPSPRRKYRRRGE